MRQHYAIAVSSPPSPEPVAIAAERLHLRLTATGSPATHTDDALVTNLIQAAREKIEADTGRALITQTIKQYLDYWPCDGIIYLMRNPVQLTSPETVVITYKDADGDAQTWAAANYIVDYKSVPARITLEYGKSFPDTRGLTNDITIQFPAGYGAAATVPESLVAALNLLVGTWYENRESIAGGFGSTDLKVVPMAYDALINPYKVWDW